MASMDASSVQTTIARGNETSVFNNQQQPACWNGLVAKNILQKKINSILTYFLTVLNKFEEDQRFVGIVDIQI